jgi:hypothetical protein
MAGAGAGADDVDVDMLEPRELRRLQESWQEGIACCSLGSCCCNVLARSFSSAMNKNEGFRDS